MKRYKRAFIKDRDARAQVNVAPKSDNDRHYQTQLAVFGALMKFEAEVQARGLEGQERARYADDLAKKATDEIQQLWKPKEG